MTSERPSLESAREHIATGDHEGAEAILLAMINENPKDLEALQTTANLYLRTKRFDQAIPILKQLVAIVPGQSEIYFKLGNACLATEDLKGSVQFFQQGLTIDTHNPQAFNNLGIALRRQVKLPEAESAFQSAIKIAPHLALPHRNLGEISRLRGDRRNALKHFENAVSADPNDAAAHNDLGMAAAALALADKAIAHFRKAIELNGTYQEAENNLAILLSATGKSAEAVQTFKLIIKRDPEFITARINLGSILIERGSFGDAIEHLEAALQLKPNHALALHHLGDLALADQYDFTDTQLSQMKQLVDSGRDGGENQIAICYTYARMLEKQKRFADAFKVYSKANSLNAQASQKKAIVFNPTEHTKKIQRSIEFFDKAFFDQQRKHDLGSDSETPIFVLGMPRSGTTLIEQIISTHPEASGAGELAAIEAVSLQISVLADSTNPYPECLLGISQKAVQSLSTQYLEKLGENRIPSRRIVDKTWYNFYFLGLIATLFPKARVIHCLRDPRDIALSCFFSNFNSIHWSWKIEDIISYYNAYCTMMDHWAETLPLNVLPVHYEALVKEQEGISRSIIDFCGLKWNDECLSFYRNQRSVQTASRVQVRKPIYNKSVGRWKSFESELVKIPEWNANFGAF